MSQRANSAYRHQTIMANTKEIPGCWAECNALMKCGLPGRCLLPDTKQDVTGLMLQPPLLEVNLASCESSYPLSTLHCWGGCAAANFQETYA